MARVFRKRRVKAALLSALVLVLAASAAILFQNFNQGTLSGAAQVVDADTLIVAEQRVRLWGIDAPEWNQTCGTPNWPCGQKATAHMRGLTAGRRLTCITFGRDKYRRMLATCRVGDVDIAADLVQAGFAIATGDYFDLEGDARRQTKNIWSGHFLTPAQWRLAQRQKGDEKGEGTPFMRKLFAQFGRNE